MVGTGPGRDFSFSSMTGALVDLARAAWERQAGGGAVLEEGRTTVLVRPESGLSPKGWIGIVRVGHAAIAVAPDQPSADLVTEVARTVSPVEMPSFDWISHGAVEVLGLPILFFGDASSIAPVSPTALSPSRLEPGDPSLQDLFNRVSSEDYDEVRMEPGDSELFGIKADDQLLAVAGYEQWPGDMAHMVVLTDPAHRRQGLARSVAHLAAAEAASRGLLVQWRARPLASQELARTLGLKELGAQTAFRFGLGG